MKIYRIIPIIGYLVELIKKDSIVDNPYFQLYHTTLGGLIGLILTILFLQ